LSQRRATTETTKTGLLGRTLAIKNKRRYRRNELKKKSGEKSEVIQWGVGVL